MMTEAVQCTVYDIASPDLEKIRNFAPTDYSTMIYSSDILLLKKVTSLFIIQLWHHNFHFSLFSVFEILIILILVYFQFSQEFYF